jgi:hypothetical protein
MGPNSRLYNGFTAMPENLEAIPARPLAAAMRSNCPQCDAHLTVMRVIPGRSSEYWTLRCTRCGGIHLDIVKISSARRRLRVP